MFTFLPDSCFYYEPARHPVPVMTTAGVVTGYPPNVASGNPPMILNPDMASRNMSAIVVVLMVISHMV